MSLGLTDRQSQILAFICDHLAEHAVPPTIREVMDRFNLKSTNSASDHLKALERKGVIVRANGKARSIRVLNRPTTAPYAAFADVEVVKADVFVNGRLIARFANPASAEGLARNLRLALRAGVAA